MSESRRGPDLAALRREYGDRGLDFPDLAPDPIAMFRGWLDDAVEAELHEPNAMVVTTVSTEGRPTARMVLLKGVDQRGFVFYTNYESRKGHDIEANPAVSLLFPWHDLQRQVRVEGTASRVSAENRFADADVPLPPQWGGFRVNPEVVEFWQGRSGRMHDRLVYRREGEEWRTARLAP